jgi:hypothetical protein
MLTGEEIRPSALHPSTREKHANPARTPSRLGLRLQCRTITYETRLGGVALRGNQERRKVRRDGALVDQSADCVGWPTTVPPSYGDMRPLSSWLRSMIAAAAVFAFPLGAQSSRDSAGVLIVENTRPAWSERERLSLAATPRLVIGNNTDSAYRFRQVRGVMLLTDGRIAVADGATLQLRMFSPEGRFLSASGGKGTGTGQLLNMGGVYRLHGDTIAIRARLSTLALYSSSGQFVQSRTLPAGADPRSANPFDLVTVLNNGAGVVAPMTMPTPRSVGARWSHSLEFKLVTASGEIARELGMLPYLELEQVSTGPTPPWLSAIGVFAGGDDRFYAGFGDRYAIRVYSGNGALQSIVRRSWTPVPITPDDWEQWVIEWSKLWVKTTGAQRERDIQEVRESPYATALPAFSRFIVDRGGRLWVREAHWQDAIGAGSLSDPPAVTSAWSVFDVRGRWLGDVSMPVGFQPFEIGADYATGTLRTDGGTRVVVYALSSRGR